MSSLQECLKLRDEFQQRWTLQAVKNMTIEQYTGIGNKDTFTYWLESRTENLISIWGGSAYKFGIFKRAQNDDKKELRSGQTGDGEYGWYVKYGNTRDEVFEKIKSLILKIINYAQNKEFENIDDIDLGDAVKWKIAFLYAPDRTLLRFVGRSAFLWLAKENGIKSKKISEIQRELIEKNTIGMDFYEYSSKLWKEYKANNDVEKDEAKDEQEDETSNGKKGVSMQPLNQILYGPPGTGKTYSVVSKALEIIEGNTSNDRSKFKDYIEKGQIKFVTFHQSYGYEEFVEGIKPVFERENQNKEIEYEIADGIFKDICEKAKGIKLEEKTNYILQDNTDIWKMSIGDTTYEGHNYLFEYCKDKKVVLLGFGNNKNFLGCNDIKSIREKLEDNDPNSYPPRAIDIFKNKIKIGDLILVSYGNTKLRAIAKVVGEYKIIDDKSLDCYMQSREVEWILLPKEPFPYRQILEKRFSQMTIYNIKDNVNKDALKAIFDNKMGTVPQSHVLIIDEINRGNISKIFGELITLIEPSKRLGADDEIVVELPYSKKEFGVPSNLYIIGTMNTADRSIALMDTALRRRFEFVEMMPQSELLKDIKIIKSGDDTDIKLNEMLKTINERIEYLYDRDHTIGHAYFMSLKDGADIEELASIFKNKILPLLQEYFYDDWEKIRLVLGDNGFIKEKEKDIKLLVLDGKEYETDKILYEIKFEAFKEPENYIKIYE